MIILIETRPIVLEAMQIDFFNEKSIEELKIWAGEDVRVYDCDLPLNNYYSIVVDVYGDATTAGQYDWIIRGVTGKFFVRPQAHFNQDYIIKGSA